MSMITDVVVVSPFSESDAIRCINSVLQTCAKGQELIPLDTSYAGGFKVMSISVYAAAFNYLPLTEFEQACISAPWCTKEGVVVYVDSEQYDGIWMWNPIRGVLCNGDWPSS